MKGFIKGLEIFLSETPMPIIISWKTLRRLKFKNGWKIWLRVLKEWG